MCSEMKSALLVKSWFHVLNFCLECVRIGFCNFHTVACELYSTLCREDQPIEAIELIFALINLNTALKSGKYCFFKSQ